MENENSCLKDSAFLITSGTASLNLKPLAPKGDEDDHFKGKSKKKKKGKTSACVVPAQMTTAPKFWDRAGVKDLFPLSHMNKEEQSNEDFEEIRFLSLEDFSVCKKLVPSRMSPVRNLWKQADFPGLHNLAEGPNQKIIGGEGCGTQTCQRMVSTSKEYSKLKPNSCMCHNVVQVSTHCQTEDMQFTVDISSSTPDALLCRKLPQELRGTVLNIISQNYENRSVITLLSCLLYRFMIDSLHKTASMDVLTVADIEAIDSLLSREMRSLSYCSSRATRGQNRLQSINTCLNNLFVRFPSLQTLPGFSDLLSSHSFE